MLVLLASLLGLRRIPLESVSSSTPSSLGSLQSFISKSKNVWLFFHYGSRCFSLDCCLGNNLIQYVCGGVCVWDFGVSGGNSQSHQAINYKNFTNISLNDCKIALLELLLQFLTI